MRLRRAALVFAISLAACEGTTASPAAVYIVDVNGGNPLVGAGQIAVTVDQGNGAHRETKLEEYRGGTFDFNVTIPSYLAATRLAVELETGDDPPQRRIGAVPTYVPASVGFAAVVLGAPLTCAEVSNPHLPEERADLALVGQGATLWAIGGTNLTASTDVPLAINAVQLTWEDAIVDATTIAIDGDFPIEPFTSGLQETQAFLLPYPAEGEQSMVVLSRSRAFLWNAYDGETSVPLHAQAGRGSTLVDLGTDGAAIVGGGDLTERAAGITWVDTAGATTQTTLATARRNPAAIFVGGVLLVAGGQQEGEPLFEIASLRSNGAALDESPTTARELPILVRDPQRRTAALLGGRDETSGALVREVLLIGGCPADCTITALPTENDWDDPRTGAAVVETARGTWILGGLSSEGPSAGAERVTVTNVATSIHALTLDVPRAHASATELAQGIVVLAGGRDATRDVDHLTMCWPAELEPLE